MNLKKNHAYLAALGIGILGVGISIGYGIGYNQPHHYLKIEGDTMLDENVGKACWAGIDYYPTVSDANGQLKPDFDGPLDGGYPRCSDLR